jgi:hypothetical protein
VAAAVAIRHLWVMNSIRVVCMIASLVSAWSSSAFAEAKAYDVVNYRGKGGGVTFALDYGAGYVEASQMRITENGKTTRFMLDTSGQMLQFVPEKKDGTNRKVVLKLGMDDAPREKIEGTYTSAGKTIEFVLRQK